jgi:hypothetical protein
MQNNSVQDNGALRKHPPHLDFANTRSRLDKTPRPHFQTPSHKRFAKNDSGFVCVNCGELVPPLLSSSRDHCTKCLCSRHVDVNPGDRANQCRGILYPIGIDRDSKKGYIIKYHCDTCHEYHTCKAAPDDNFDEILRLSSFNK